MPNVCKNGPKLFSKCYDFLCLWWYLVFFLGSTQKKFHNPTATNINYYHKVASSMMSRLVAHTGIFRLFMKWIVDQAEAKFWISSSFNKFLFRIFVVLDFEVVWPRRPQRPQKRHTETFWKWPQINANFPKINGRYES